MFCRCFGMIFSWQFKQLHCLPLAFTQQFVSPVWSIASSMTDCCRPDQVPSRCCFKSSTLCNNTKAGTRLLTITPSKHLYAAVQSFGNISAKYLVCRGETSQTQALLMTFSASTARLSWPGWLVTYRDGCLPACRRSPIQVLTGPSVD